MRLLEEYNKKRDFRSTPEPKGELIKNSPGRFVVQRHRASRLHYDLRLEMEGVLKSWAVPKGPSMNPADKRLAVHTEDHPVKYLTFEGTIPKGNYGAGEMRIWEEGTYKISGGGDEEEALEQLENGSLKIILAGKKLKGEFALVRTKRGKDDRSWLLIKKTDKYATELDYDAEEYISQEEKQAKEEKAAPKPKKQPKVRKFHPEDPVKPMLATLTKKIFNDKDWIFENKWDGYRALANIRNGKVSLYSRNGISFNSRYPSIVEGLEQISQDVILDGEIVLIDENGVPDFQKLQNYGQGVKGSLHFYVFDMLHLNGHSMLELQLLERKSLIPEVLEDIDNIFYCDHIEGMGTAFYNRMVDAGMEGVIAKKADSVYVPGGRSRDWLKIKAVRSQEAVICGYTESEGAAFGSLILGIYKDTELTYIGNCGTGFSAKERKELLAIMQAIEKKDSPFAEDISLKGRDAHWLKPELICEVKFTEWTREERLRHPVYKGLREDKTLPEISREKAVKAPEKAKTAKAEKGVKSAKSAKSAELEIDDISVPFTNLDKIYWPDSGFRKYDLIDYYMKVSDLMLPYLKDRPQNLHRHPNGISKKGFYQKDVEGSMPDWVETTKIFSESTGKDIEYLVCQNQATLLYMANLGCIEINPWNSRIQQLEKPDYTVIDIDPSKNTSFEEVIEVARAGKEVLDKAGIEGYCKTSGSSGLHIYLPLGAAYTFEEARDFTKLLCYFIQEKLPKLTSLERSVKKRKGKIYMDYMQNAKGQTLAAPYCVRPRKGATVSAPLEWSEVKPGLKVSDFTIESMPDRIGKMKEDPFKGVLEKGIDMEKAIDRLEGE